MVTRRTLLAGGVGLGASALTGLVVAGTRSTPEPSAELVGYTIVNVREDTTVPIDEFVADLDRAIRNGARAVRLEVPFFLAGLTQDHELRRRDAGLTGLDHQLALARERSLAVVAVVNSPVLDPENPDPAHTLALNRQCAAELARVADGRVACWQVLNEWNLRNAIDGAVLEPNPSPEYIALVRRWLSEIGRELRPSQSPALLTTSVGGYPPSPDQWGRWEQLMRAVDTGLDAWGVSVYPDPGLPERIREQGQQLTRLQRVAGKRVIVMEVGMSMPAGRQRQVGASLLPAMVRAVGAVEPAGLFVYQLRDRHDGTSPAERAFGLYDDQGVAKDALLPTARELRRLTVGW